MGRFYLSYVEQENLLPRLFPPEIPNKTPFPLLLLIRFHKKTIPLAVHNYIAFTQIAARGWPYYVPRSKDRLPLKELSKIVLVGLDQQTPTLSTHFFISVLYLIINQAGQVQLQPGLNGGPVY